MTHDSWYATEIKPLKNQTIFETQFNTYNILLKYNSESHTIGAELFKICFYSVINSYSLALMVTVVENGHGDTSSNPGRDWLHFT